MRLFQTPGVTLADLLVFAYIDHRCGKRGYWYGRQLDIAEGLGLGERTVRQSIARLAGWGFIEKERQGSDRATMLLYAVVPQLVEAPTDRQDSAGRSDDRPAEECRWQRQDSAAPTPLLDPPETNPSNQIHTPRATAAANASEIRPDAEAFAALVALHGECTAAFMGERVRSELAMWAEVLTAAHVAEIREEAGHAGDAHSWPLVRTIAGEAVAAIQRDGSWTPRSQRAAERARAGADAQGDRAHAAAAGARGLARDVPRPTANRSPGYPAGHRPGRPVTSLDEFADDWGAHG